VTTPTEWLRDALIARLDAEAETERAFGTARSAEARKHAAAMRARLGTGEARERLEEAVSTRAIDEASYAAILAHLASAAEAEVLARAGVVLELDASDRVVVADRACSLLELVGEARDADAETARRAIAALASEATRGRAQRTEALAEAEERASRVRARGPAHPDDADAALPDRCRAFLDATDEAAEEIVARAHHASSTDAHSLVGRANALAPRELDRALARPGRTQRITRTLGWSGLDRELARRVTVEPSRALSLAPRVAVTSTRAVVFASPIEAGIASERALLGASVEALVRSLVSPDASIEHARPPIGSAACAARALFELPFATRTFVSRYAEVGRRESDTVRVASAAASLLEARYACARMLAGSARAHVDDGTRERMAHALRLDPRDVSDELARSSRCPRDRAVTDARARLAALGWSRALRERYDEDWFRNPRLGDFVRGLAARGGIVSAEEISRELGASADDAVHAATALAHAGG
jgi:hypothetical protein